MRRRGTLTCSLAALVINGLSVDAFARISQWLGGDVTISELLYRYNGVPDTVPNTVDLTGDQVSGSIQVTGNDNVTLQPIGGAHSYEGHQHTLPGLPHAYVFNLHRLFRLRISVQVAV